MNHVYIDPTMSDEIALHLFRNYRSAGFAHPLLLAITGPSGEGKTFQTDEALRRLGATAYRIESGELESELAGQPAERIRLNYLRAGSEGGEFPVVVINDLDTAVGDWGDQVQYTVNRQAVFGQLMALCDAPTVVNNQACARVPVIVTGNDFTRLYTPLTRAGRMRTFPWVPTVEQRLPVLRTFFPSLDGAQVRRLAAAYPDHPVAFWASVAGALDDAFTLDEIRRLGPVTALRMAKEGLSPPFDFSSVVVDDVLRVADQMATSSRHRNHLAGTEEVA